MSQTQTNKNLFACLELSSGLLRTLDSLNFIEPTPIQAEAIPTILTGRDLIGIAQTGTGKTLAFGLPIIERLRETGGVALVLAPTRELALQIEETFIKVGRPHGIRPCVLIGGAPMNKQIAQLRSNPNVVIATPGRLMDHMQQRTISLKYAEVVVLDEADRMLDMGFAPAINRILDETPRDRQTLLFSATMPAPIAALASKYLSNPIRVDVAPAGTTSERIKQELIVVDKPNKLEMLDLILKTGNGTVLVFSRTRHGAHKIARNLRELGHSTAEIHSDRTLAQRKAALDGFKNGRFRILVATDIAARGIDVKQIGLVVNFDLPDNPEDYVHRIGRTGRAGEDGHAITFATPDQGKDVREIEKLTRVELPISKRSPITLARPVAPVPHSRPKAPAAQHRFGPPAGRNRFRPTRTRR